MIAKYKIGLHKEGNELYILIWFVDSQNRMEEFLELNMGIKQVLSTTEFDFLSYYQHLEGVNYKTYRCLNYQVIQSSLIHIDGECFRIEFPIEKDNCLNVELNEVLDIINNDNKKYVVFTSSSQDYKKSIFISELRK